MPLRVRRRVVPHTPSGLESTWMRSKMCAVAVYWPEVASSMSTIQIEKTWLSRTQTRPRSRWLQISLGPPGERARISSPVAPVITAFSQRIAVGARRIAWRVPGPAA